MTEAEAAYLLLGPEQPPRGTFNRWWDTGAQSLPANWPIKQLIEAAFNAGYAAGWYADFRKKLNVGRCADL